MSFTTWENLRIKMLDDLASGNWHIEEYTIGGRNIKYRSFPEFKKALLFVEEMAARESGNYCDEEIAVSDPGGHF